MNQTAMMVLGIGGIIVIYFVIRFVVRSVFNKAEDALQNKLAERKNAKNNNREEDLSDRYK